MRDSLKYQPGVQFAIFMGIAAAMFLTYTLLVQAFFHPVIGALTTPGATISEETLVQFRWAQFISAVMTFIIPAVGYALLCDKQPFALLDLKRNVNIFILLLALYRKKIMTAFLPYFLHQENIISASLPFRGD